MASEATEPRWRAPKDLPDFLTLWPNDEIVLSGHRIGLHSVFDRVQRGFSADEICTEFPTLEPDLIQQMLACYASHRREVDAYVAEYRADLLKQEAAAECSGGVLDIRQLAGGRAAASDARNDS
jgi:uncharacterized protein (DUF433 family)